MKNFLILIALGFALASSQSNAQNNNGPSSDCAVDDNYSKEFINPCKYDELESYIKRKMGIAEWDIITPTGAKTIVDHAPTNGLSNILSESEIETFYLGIIQKYLAQALRLLDQQEVLVNSAKYKHELGMQMAALRGSAKDQKELKLMESYIDYYLADSLNDLNSTNALSKRNFEIINEVKAAQ